MARYAERLRQQMELAVELSRTSNPGAAMQEYLHACTELDKATALSDAFRVTASRFMQRKLASMLQGLGNSNYRVSQEMASRVFDPHPG